MPAEQAAGATVGYTVRFESAVSSRTRIEVVTEGVLVRRLQRDPALPGVSAVLLDEFHERNLDGDLCLALCCEARSSSPFQRTRITHMYNSSPRSPTSSSGLRPRPQPGASAMLLRLSSHL